MKINVGDKLFFKTKKGIFHEVEVIAIFTEGYALVQGDGYTFGCKKVKFEKLRKRPSKEFLQMQSHNKQLLNRMERDLREARGEL